MLMDFLDHLTTLWSGGEDVRYLLYLCNDLVPLVM
jgi:hypothetical protein